MKVIKDDVYKELDLIQKCITRMATNSFYIKGWHIGLLTVLVAFFVSREKVDYIVLFSIIFVVTIIFWCLYSYYLLLERKYQWVISKRIYSNETSNLFNLNPN